jgi:tetratricopeptide (TPR) repeat protein
MSMTPDPGRRLALERLAAVLDASRDPEDPVGRRHLARQLRHVAAGTALHDDPVVREIRDAFPPGGDHLTQAGLDTDEVAPAAVAAVLDRLSAHDRGPGGLCTDPTPAPVVDPLRGPTTRRTAASPNPGRRRPTRADLPSGDPVGQWRNEMSQLFRGSPLSDPEVAAELHSRGVDVPPQTFLDVPEDARAVQAVIEILGGHWVEDNYRTLYEAARRDQEPNTPPAVQRRLSGLVSADALDLTRVGALIQPPPQDIPRLLTRHRLIASLLDGLEEPKRPTQVLLGAGGYGKSTVALATAQSAQQRHVVPLWVPASDLDALADGLHRAAIWTGATALEIDAALAAHDDRRIARLWELLDNALCRWFLVLDDAGPGAVGHPGWVHRSPTGTTVVTTRHGDPETWGPNAEVTPVGKLADDEGARLLLDRISVAGSRMTAGLEGQARHLSRLLNGVPLALTGVGSLLASHRGGRTLGELVERLQPAVAATAVATMYRFCLQSFDVTDQVPARHLLRLVAAFAPDEALPVHLFDDAVERMWGGVDGVAELVRVGLVDELPPFGGEPRCVRMHPAVADHSRHDTAFSVEVVGQITHRAIALLGAELDRLDPGAPAAWLRIRRLEPHIAEAVDSSADGSAAQQASALALAVRAVGAMTQAGSHQAAATLLDRALDRLHRVDQRDPVWLSVRYMRARMLTLDDNGNLAAAAEAVAALRHDLARLRDADDPGALTAADVLAWLTAEQGHLDMARIGFADVLARRTRVLGADHPDTLTTRHRLAWVDALLGREAAVVEEFRDVLRLRRDRLGFDHMDVYATRYRLAWVLNKTGRHTEAEQLFRELQLDLEAVVGELHPMTLIVRHRHAWTLCALDRLTEAGESYRGLRRDQEKVLGREHPRALATRLAQARLALQQGGVPAVIPQFRTVADLYRERLGDDHPRTMEARSWLARALLEAGRAAAAERGFRAVLADRNRLLGPDHPDTLQARLFIGRALVRRGRLADAEHELARLLADERLLLLEDRNMLPVRHALARAIGLRGRYDQSEQDLRAVVEERAAVLGARHRRTMITRDHLSWILGRAGRSAEGLVVCRGVLADRQRVLGPGHRHTLASRYREAWLTGLLGDTSASGTLFRGLLPDLVQHLGSDHPETLRCRAGLVRLTRVGGRLDDAAAAAGQLVADQRRVQGVDAVDTLRARHELGLVLIACGDLDRGRAALRAVLADRERLLDADHPETLATRGALG